jgi:hypothetical protein
MTRNMLKMIALISMTIDHIGLFLISSDTVLYTMMRILGRVAFPLFAFMIAEGFLHTSNLKRYMLRLLFLGLTTEVIFLGIYLFSGFNLTHFWFLEGSGFRMNIVWTLLLGLIGLSLIKKYEPFSILILTVLFMVSIVLPYGFYGFGLIMIFGMIQSPKQKWGYAVGLSIIYCLYPALSLGIEGINWIQLFALMAIPILMLYHGERGHASLKFAYLYYPLHIVVIYLIQLWT